MNQGTMKVWICFCVPASHLSVFVSILYYHKHCDLMTSLLSSNVSLPACFFLLLLTSSFIALTIYLHINVRISLYVSTNNSSKILIGIALDQ